MSLSTKQAEFVADMAEYDNWTDKFNRIMEYGEALPTYPEAYSISRFIVSVEGCTSVNYLAIGHNSVNVYLFGKSNAAIPKGLIGVLYFIYNGQSMADIDAFTPTFIETTGLNNALSPQRLALLREMIRRIHAYAQGEVIVAPPTPQEEINSLDIAKLKGWANEDIEKAKVSDWMAKHLTMNNKYLETEMMKATLSDRVAYWSLMLSALGQNNYGWVPFDNRHMCFVMVKLSTTGWPDVGNYNKAACIYIPHYASSAVIFEKYEDGVLTRVGQYEGAAYNSYTLMSEILALNTRMNNKYDALDARVTALENE